MSIEYIEQNEDFLSQVPIALLEESILTQFKNPDNFRSDYVASFISSFNYSKGMIENDDDNNELMSNYDSFCGFMLDIFAEKLGIGIDNFEEMSIEEQMELIHFTYRFFVINIKRNFYNLFLNYINQNKEMLVDKASRKKDVTSQAFKKEISDEDTAILANLADIMNFITTEANLTVDDFLTLCECDSPCAETALVSEYYDDFILTGNFIEKYVRMLRIPMRIRIEADIRNYILKSYRKEHPLKPRDEIDEI